MFSKNSEKLESFIGAKSNFQGEVNVKGTVRLDGRVEGRVNADCVVLSETAEIKGETTAKKIIVGGKVEGILRALEIVEIRATGKVLGDIFAPKFSVTEGGEFNGRIEMKKEENKGLDFEAKTEEV
jgi:cytoskeletal protein CcmA (bactofilin family)